jgi:hypothetical protein
MITRVWAEPATAESCFQLTGCPDLMNFNDHSSRGRELVVVGSSVSQDPSGLIPGTWHAPEHVAQPAA